MKNKWHLVSFVMIAGFIVLLIGASLLSNKGMVLLQEVFPELPEGKDFQAEILWDGAEEGIPVLLTDFQFQSILCATQVKEENSGENLKNPRFQIQFAGPQHDYSAEISAVGQICIAQTDDPENSARFFMDHSHTIYRSLYEEHLLSGGGEIPEA